MSVNSLLLSAYRCNTGSFRACQCSTGILGACQCSIGILGAYQFSGIPEQYWYFYHYPSKHAGSNLETFLVMASVQPESGRDVYAGSDFPHLIRFHSSKKRGLDHIVQNQPGSDLDGQVQFWSNASGQEREKACWHA